jgi:hypothetical protein
MKGSNLLVRKKEGEMASEKKGEEEKKNANK